MKLFMLCNTIARVALFLCITYLVIHFNNPRMAWWYLIPALAMSPTLKSN